MAEPGLADDRPATAGQLQRLCRTAERDLSVDGVGVSLLSEAGDLLGVAASNSFSERVEELQFTMGEGPCLAAFELRRPVLVSDLSGEASHWWPGYAPAALDLGVRAVFAFPLQVGVAHLGALDVYRGEAGSLSYWAMQRSLAYAEAALDALLGAKQSPVALAALLHGGGNRFEVYQAQGMVMIQLGVPAGQALARIRAYAYSHDRLIGEVADDIVARKIVLERDSPPRRGGAKT